MNELLPHFSDNPEIVKQQQKKNELMLKGSLKPYKNHILFEINIITGLVVPASYTETREINYMDALANKFPKKKNVIINPSCVYISALNKQNALKIFNSELHDHKNTPHTRKRLVR